MMIVYYKHYSARSLMLSRLYGLPLRIMCCDIRVYIVNVHVLSTVYSLYFCLSCCFFGE